MSTPRIILVRHAHAEWPDYRGRDFDRPLTERGRADAARSAAAIHAEDLKPDALLASPAQRTRETAAILAAALGIAEASIQYIDSLYNASAGTLQLELERAAGQHAVVMLVAHNPGISDLGRRLADDAEFTPFAPAHWRQFAVKFTS